MAKNEAVASMSQKKNTKMIRKFILRKYKVVMLRWE